MQTFTRIQDLEENMRQWRAYLNTLPALGACGVNVSGSIAHVETVVLPDLETQRAALVDQYRAEREAFASAPPEPTAADRQQAAAKRVEMKRAARRAAAHSSLNF